LIAAREKRRRAGALTAPAPSNTSWSKPAGHYITAARRSVRVLRKGVGLGHHPQRARLLQDLGIRQMRVSAACRCSESGRGRRRSCQWSSSPWMAAGTGSGKRPAARWRSRACCRAAYRSTPAPGWNVGQTSRRGDEELGVLSCRSNPPAAVFDVSRR